MICPKCNKHDQYGNFCSNCGLALKEKCRECGKMEKINRVFCEKKVNEARERLNKYVSAREKTGLYGLIGLLLMICACLVVIFPLTIFSAGLKDYIWAGPLSAGLIFLFFHVMLRPLKLSRIAKEEFLRLNPQDAELLKN